MCLETVYEINYKQYFSNRIASVSAVAHDYSNKLVVNTPESPSYNILLLGTRNHRLDSLVL